MVALAYRAQAYDGPEGGVAAGLRRLLTQKDALVQTKGCDLDRW
jgi:hypothetical protein